MCVGIEGGTSQSFGISKLANKKPKTFAFLVCENKEYYYVEIGIRGPDPAKW